MKRLGDPQYDSPAMEKDYGVCEQIDAEEALRAIGAKYGNHRY